MDSPAHYFEFLQKTFEGKMIVDVKVREELGWWMGWWIGGGGGGVV